MENFRIVSAIFLFSFCLTQAERVEDVWTGWSRWSSCSTTCGQGVRFRERECVGYDGFRVFRVENPRCPGIKHEYSTCEDRACAIGSKDMYEYQCSEKNREKVSGKYHHWVPFTGMNMAARCELACVASRHNFYYNFGEALDGTPCGERTDDGQFLCVDGVCKMFGCDGKADSHKTMDWCKVCGGENKNCSYIRESFDTRRSKHYGYELVVKIPAGATYIEVTDKSYNYLAISDAQDMFLINGNFMLDWSGEYPYAGTTVKYSRNSTLETIQAEGPTNMDLYVKLIFREYNPGVQYQFFIPTSQVDNIDRPESSNYDNRPYIGPLQPNRHPNKDEKTYNKGNHENEVFKDDTGYNGDDHEHIKENLVHEIQGGTLDLDNTNGNLDIEQPLENTINPDGDQQDAGYHNGEQGDRTEQVYEPYNFDPEYFEEPFHNFQDAVYDGTNYLEDILNQKEVHIANAQDPYGYDPPDGENAQDPYGYELSDGENAQDPYRYELANGANEYKYEFDSDEYQYDPSRYIYDDFAGDNGIGAPYVDPYNIPDNYYYNNGISSFNPDSVEDPRQFESDPQSDVFMDEAQAQLYPNQAFWQSIAQPNSKSENTRKANHHRNQHHTRYYDNIKYNNQNHPGESNLFYPVVPDHHEQDRDDHVRPYTSDELNARYYNRGIPNMDDIDPERSDFQPAHNVDEKINHQPSSENYDHKAAIHIDLLPPNERGHHAGPFETPDRFEAPDPKPTDYASEDEDIWNQLFGVFDENTEDREQESSQFDNNGKYDGSHNNGYQGYLIDPEYDLNNQRNNNANRNDIIDPNDPYNTQDGGNGPVELEEEELLHISDPNFNYNQPDQNYPGDPYSESFRHHDSSPHGSQDNSETANGEPSKGREEDLNVAPTTSSPGEKKEPTETPVPHHPREEDVEDNYLYGDYKDDTRKQDYDWSDYSVFGRKHGGYRLDEYGAHCPVCARNVPNKSYICESDFKIRGLIDNAEEIRGDTRYEVRVVDSYKSDIQLMTREYIWAHGACPCPLLRVNEEYILVGKLISNFRTRESRLMLEESGYITNFKTTHLARFRSILKTIKCD